MSEKIKEMKMQKETLSLIGESKEWGRMSYEFST
jgi:hypothetical protein